MTTGEGPTAYSFAPTPQQQQAAVRRLPTAACRTPSPPLSSALPPFLLQWRPRQCVSISAASCQLAACSAHRVYIQLTRRCWRRLPPAACDAGGTVARP